MTTLYHNQGCSKSRQTLALLREHGIEPEIVEYLTAPPDAVQLKMILQRLGCTVREVIRRGEAEYHELGLGDESLSEERLIELVAAHPKLLQRPIVVHRGKAVVGRPPRNVLSLL